MGVWVLQGDTNLIMTYSVIDRSKIPIMTSQLLKQVSYSTT